jgi:hypothetical protein
MCLSLQRPPLLKLFYKSMQQNKKSTFRKSHSDAYDWVPTDQMSFDLVFITLSPEVITTAVIGSFGLAHPSETPGSNWNK